MNDDTATHRLFSSLGAPRAFAAPPDPGTPASLVRSIAGATVAILDSAAAAEL